MRCCLEVTKFLSNGRRFSRLELRASEPIKKGQEIVNQYVKPNIGTVSRRLILKNKWHFDCDCKRCNDPTEFGSNLSAILCQNCNGGKVLPKKPLNPTMAWSCGDCQAEVSVDQVSNALMEAEEALKASRPDEDIVQHYERSVLPL